MDIGLFTSIYNDLSLEEILKRVKDTSIKYLEIGTGGYPGNSHIDLDELLNSREKRNEYLSKLEDNGLTISALSCHSNPLSPLVEEAKKADELIRKTIQLASLMDVPVVNTFSGTSSGNSSDKVVNWPTTPWPNEYSDNYLYQWEYKLIPYWKDINRLSMESGVKIGIELHGGFLCHSPYTLLKLRESTGEAIGCNFDPSHMWWQLIDPVEAINILGEKGAIHHFHAKDTYLNKDNINMHGVLDMQPYTNVETRSWIFRTIGYGHNMNEWKLMIDALKNQDYDYSISIEHEDLLMSVEEGLSKAIANLDTII